uniref:Uncharacterized protein n=1 Tax=Romanomermis culicivorax TaxID=13658 RepID=A0A915I729_ROMCU
MFHIRRLPMLILITQVLISLWSDGKKPKTAPELKKQCKCRKNTTHINCNDKASSIDVCWYCQYEKNCGRKAVELRIDPNENLTSSKYLIEECCDKIKTVVLKDVRKCGEFCSEEWVTKTEDGLPCHCKLSPHTRPISESTTPSTTPKAFTMVLEVSVVLFSLPCLVLSALLAYCYKKGRSVEIPIKEMIERRQNTQNIVEPCVQDDLNDDRMIEDVMGHIEVFEPAIDKLIQLDDEQGDSQLSFENPSFIENESQSQITDVRLLDV